jgi:hypothetical protein
MSINTYYDTLIAKVENVPSCDELATLTAENDAIVAAQLAAIQDQIDILAPLLIVPGTNLSQIVTWIQSMVDVFTVPALALPQQLIDVGLKADELTVATAAKFSEL